MTSPQAHEVPCGQTSSILDMLPEAQRLLPRWGQISVEDVARAIRLAPRLVGAGDRIEIRSVLLPQQERDRFAQATTVAQLGAGDGDERDAPDELRLERAWLLKTTTDTESLGSAEDLQDVLAFWRHKSREPFPPIFGNASVYRRWSRNEWTRTPCWVVQLHVVGAQRPWAVDGLSDPFFVPAYRIAVENAEELVRHWVHGPVSMAGNTSPHIAVIIPDHRAFIGHIAADDGTLVVDVTGQRLPEAICWVRVVDYDGNASDHTSLVESGRLTIPLPRPPRDLTIRIWTNDGEQLDEYRELSGHSSWGRSVLAGSRAGPGPRQATLLTALDAGESDTVEFKPVVALQRGDRKLMEVVETAVAFSNAKGGAIYIGVTDHGQPFDATRDVMKALKEFAQDGVSANRSRYARGLKQLLAEMVAPSILPRFDWIDLGDAWVLEILIPPGSETPYEIRDGHHQFVRRGATNRRMSREELIMAIRRA